MSEKQFSVFPNNVVWDNQLNKVVCRCILEGIGDAENVCQRLNELSEEIMSLRWENTKLKLVLEDIVEDLETEAERKVPIIIQKEYVDWVKSNVNLRLNSSKLNRLGDKDE